MCKRWPNWSVNHPKAHQRRDPENQTPPNGNLLSFTLLFLVTLFLAYANGANDNFKGVATLYGSQATTFRTALIIGTVSTLAGSICSLFLAEALVKAFSGKGLVPDEISMSSNFLLAVATGAATTVFVTALVGLPISTTHALIGALTGAGLIAAGAQVNFSMLGAKFVLPLLLSPLACILITMPVYRLGQMVSARLGLKKESYLHISPGKLVPTRVWHLKPARRGIGAAKKTPKGFISIEGKNASGEKHNGNFFGIEIQRLIHILHHLSAIAVSFSRGLNDTPKIVGLLIVIKALDIHYGMLAVATAMAVGGLINARKVAQTMSKKITTMNDGQALCANLVTAFMVFFASRFGLPVSTTHVSVGAITGVGIVNGTANGGVITGILISWVLTLPMAALISATAYWLATVGG